VSQVPGILQDKTYFYEMPELKGRYVRIEHSKRKKLDLVEVKVVSGDENIAINKKATQSHLNGKRVARLAIDGDMETYSSVGRPNASSWWELDLGSAQNVDKIEIYNEQSKSRFFDGFNVSVLDENRTLIWEMKNCRQGLKTVFQGEVPRLNVNEKFTALRPNTSVD
jgi:hypothetical protein